MVTEKSERQKGEHRAARKENISPKPLPSKMKADFPAFCNQWGLKTGVLKVGRLGWDRDLKVLPACLERRQANNPGADGGVEAQT